MDAPIADLPLRRADLPRRSLELDLPPDQPTPFNERFYICLTQALGIGTNEFTPGTTPLPATTSVDCVRVWGLPSASG